MDDNIAVTIWLVSVLAILIGSGFYRIWQGELRTPALLQQINDLQRQNAYLQAENTKLSLQSDNPPAPPPARGWFRRLLWGPELAPNVNIVQQQNSSLLQRIGTLRQQFDALREHNGDLEQQNDKLRNELGNGVASDSEDLDKLGDWFVDRIVELEEGIKERDDQLHALGEENENFRIENDDLRTTYNNENTRRNERIKHLEEENRILRDTEGGEVSPAVLTQLETVLDQTRQSNSGLRAELKTAKVEISRLGDQKKGPEANAQAAAEKMAHFEAENNALKIERDTVQTYLNTANEGKANLQHQLEDALARLNTAEDKNKHIEIVEDELKEANKFNAELPARHETSQRHERATTADITRLASEVQKLTAKNTKLTTQLETTEAQLMEAADDAVKLKLQLADCSAARVKSNAAIKSLIDADEANARLNDGLNEANVKIKDLKTRLELMTTAWEKALSSITRVEEQAMQKDSEQLAQLKFDYAKACAEVHEKGHDLEELQTRYDQLDEHFAAQIQDLARETAAHRQCSEEINRLNDLIQANIKTVDTAPIKPNKNPLTRSIINTASTSPVKPLVAKLGFSTLTTTDTTPIEPTNLAARVEELESQLQTTTEERDTARKDLDQERSDHSSDAEECTSENNQLRAAQDTLEAQLQQAQTRVTDLEGELRTAKEEHDASVSSNAQAKKKDLKRIANLESNLENARKELETEREGRASDNQACESKKAELEAKIKANINNAQFSRNVTKLEGQVKLANERVSQRLTDCENNKLAPTLKCNPLKNQDPGSDNESGAKEQLPREEDSQNKEEPSSCRDPATQEQPHSPATPASTHPTDEIIRVPEPTSSPLEQVLNVEKLSHVRNSQKLSPASTSAQPSIVVQLPVAAEQDANAKPGPYDLVCEPRCGYRIRALVPESIAQMNRHQQDCPDHQAEVMRVEREAEQNPSNVTCDNCNQFWSRDLVSFNKEHAGGRNPCTPDTPHMWQPYSGMNQPPDAKCDLCKETFPGKNRAWLKNEHWPECARKYQEEHGEANRKNRKIGDPVTCDNCGQVYYIGRHTSMNGFHDNHNDQCRKENPRKNENVKGKSRYEKINCERCGTQFSREEMFKAQFGHAYNCPMIPTPSEGKCRHCEAEFTSKDQLVTQHIQAGKCPKKPKKVKCISCREEFTGQTDRWLKTVHLPKCPGRIPQSEDDRTCKNCKYVFLSKNDMFRHLGIGNSEPKQDPQCRKYKHVPPPKSWGAQPPAKALTPTSPVPSQQGFGGKKTGPENSVPSPRLNTGTNRVGRNSTPITPLSGRASSFIQSSSIPGSGHYTPTQAHDPGHTTPFKHNQRPDTYPPGGSSMSGTTQNNGSKPPRVGELAGRDSEPFSISGVIIPPLNIQQSLTAQEPAGIVQTKENYSTDLYANPSSSHRTAKLPATTTSPNTPQPTSTPTSQPLVNIQTSSNLSTTNNNVQNTGLAQPKPSSKTTDGLIENSWYAPSDASISETATQSQVTQNTPDPQTTPPVTLSRNSTLNSAIGTQKQSVSQPLPTVTTTQTPVIDITTKASTPNLSTGAQAQKALQANSQPKPAKSTGGLMGKSIWAPDGTGAATNSTTPQASSARNDRKDERGIGGGQKPRQDSSGSIGSVSNNPKPPTTDKARCTYCKSKNHTEANCGKKESDSKCPYCRQTDHNEVGKCPFKKSDEKKGRLREKCGYCSLWGHTEDVCIKKEKNTAFAARRGGNSQAGNNQTGSGRGRDGGRGHGGNNQGATLPACGSIISYGSGTANIDTGTASQTPEAGTTPNAQVSARNTQQAGTAQLRLDPKYDAKANRWADMEDDSGL